MFSQIGVSKFPIFVVHCAVAEAMNMTHETHTHAHTHTHRPALADGFDEHEN